MIHDRRKGCFYGLAIGDALGAAVEFKAPGEFAPIFTYRDGGPFNLNKGEWTDDTSMALALADSIAVAGWDLKDQLTRYVDWRENGKYSVNGRCFDIGGTTSQGLDSFLKNGTTTAPYDSLSLGNGSIMRLASVPIAFYEHENVCNYAKESSITTHSGEACIEACAFLTNLLINLFRGKDKDTAIEEASTIVILNQGIAVVTAGCSFKNEPPYIQGTGYVVKSLEAALWAFYKASSFEEAVMLAVNLGDDSDTTGAITGQMAGAYWGYSGIPQYLIDGLARKDMIDQYLDPIL